MFLGLGGGLLAHEEAVEEAFAREPFTAYEDALSDELSPGPDRPPRRVSVALQHLFMIPGQSAAKVELSDEDGDEIETYEFSTGWRIDCRSARVVPYPGRAGTELVEISCAPAINGRMLSKQYYGVTPDDRLALIRFETAEGVFGGLTMYTYPNHTIGPVPPRRAPAEWRAALDSGDPVRVLEALMWIGGDHAPPGGAGDGASVEDGESASNAWALRADAAVTSSVRSLAASRDSWIASAAIATLSAIGQALLEECETIWRARLAAKDWEGALTVLTEVVSRSRELAPTPGLAEALKARARLLARLGRLTEAAADLDAVVKINQASFDGSFWKHLVRGFDRLQRGDRDGGLADLRRAAELHPKDPWAPLWIAVTTGESAEGLLVGEAWLGEVWRFTGGELGAEDLLARVTTAEGRAKPSERLLVAHCFIGVAAERDGDVEVAKAHYQACLATGEELWTEFEWAIYRLAQLTAPAGR